MFSECLGKILAGSFHLFLEKSQNIDSSRMSDETHQLHILLDFVSDAYKESF